MFMRFLQLKVKSAEIQGLARMYEDRIMPSLQSAGGCLGAFLVQSDRQPQEMISMTLWRSEEASSAYERSGLFMQLVANARPFFAESTEWKLALSKDFTLEYTQDSAEPALETYSVSSASAGSLPPTHNKSPLFMRIVSLHLKPGKLDEYREIYQRRIIPTLMTIRGCQYACLSSPASELNESISVTLWNSRADAEEYERSGMFKQLLQEVKHTLSDLTQLQMESRGTRLPSTTWLSTCFTRWKCRARMYRSWKAY